MSQIHLGGIRAVTYSLGGVELVMNDVFFFVVTLLIFILIFILGALLLNFNVDIKSLEKELEDLEPLDKRIT